MSMVTYDERVYWTSVIVADLPEYGYNALIPRIAPISPETIVSHTFNECQLLLDFLYRVSCLVLVKYSLSCQQLSSTTLTCLMFSIEPEVLLSYYYCAPPTLCIQPADIFITLHFELTSSTYLLCFLLCAWNAHLVLLQGL